MSGDAENDDFRYLTDQQDKKSRFRSSSLLNVGKDEKQHNPNYDLDEHLGCTVHLDWPSFLVELR